MIGSNVTLKRNVYLPPEGNHSLEDLRLKLWQKNGRAPVTLGDTVTALLTLVDEDLAQKYPQHRDLIRNA